MKRNPRKYNAHKKMNCEACGVHGSQMILDIDHIKTFASGGSDEEYNTWTLCRKCHIKKGVLGLRKFVARHPSAATLLAEKGWYMNAFNGWWNDKINAKTEEDGA